jgi:putative oxidoreductase
MIPRLTAEGTMETDSQIDRRRLLIPGLAGLYEAFSPYSYAFMRFATGIVLVPHGIDKLFFRPIEPFAAGIAQHGLPAPTLLAWLTVLTESFGAAFLAFGLFTRFAAAAVIIEMIVVTFIFQWPNGYFWTNRGYEYPLLWLLLSIAIFFRGGGRYSLDHLLGKEI